MDTTTTIKNNTSTSIVDDENDGNTTKTIVTNDDNSIMAEVQYDINDRLRHRTYLGPSPYEGFNNIVGARSIQNVQINDGRGRQDDLKLDDAAFELVNCPTELSTEDFYSIQEGDETIKEKYYEEVREMVKRQVGCDKVIIIHSQVRNESKSNGQVF